MVQGEPGADRREQIITNITDVERKHQSGDHNVEVHPPSLEEKYQHDRKGKEIETGVHYLQKFGKKRVCNAFEQHRRVNAEKEKPVNMNKVCVYIVGIYKRNQVMMLEIDEPSGDYDIDIPEVRKPLPSDTAMKKPDGQNEHDQ